MVFAMHLDQKGFCGHGRELRVGGTVFGVICLARLTRVLVFREVVVLVGGYRMPLCPSMVAAVVLGALTFWMWKVSYSTDRRRGGG